MVHLGKKQVEAGVNRVGGSANPVGESMGGGEHKGDAKHKGTAGATVVVVPRSPYSWMPYWGNATKQRAQLGKEIRAYWAHKWCTKTLPEMKKAILDSTPIPEDVYDEHFAGIFEYPHEIKNV